MTARLIAILLVLLMMAGCRREEGVQGPIIQATLTPTPRSTPLPPVPTVIPPGTEANPLRMVIRPPLSAVARSLITDFQAGQFEAALLETSGLVVDVTVVERYAEALSALCDSTPAQVTVAWLDGVSYQVATAQGCGSPALLAERDGQMGDAVQLITRRDGPVESVRDVLGAQFCRISYNDYDTWLLPALLLQSQGLDPDTAPAAIRDYPDSDSLVAALLDGDCDVAGMAVSTFDDLSSATRGDLRVLETTPPFPYSVLMYPISLPLGERLRLGEALLTMAQENAALLEPFFGQDGLAAAVVDDFEALTDFLGRTGLDFVRLGA